MSDDQVWVKPLSMGDLGALQQLARATFTEAFAADNSPENLSAYLATAFSAEKLSAELANPDCAFYFAQLGAEPVGYLKLNRSGAQTEKLPADCMEIERIFVLNAFLGKGVGQLLFDFALQRAKACQAEYLWLGVWEKNPRAIRFYEKNGMVAFDEHVFMLGDDAQRDVMMRMRIEK